MQPKTRSIASWILSALVLTAAACSAPEKASPDGDTGQSTANDADQALSDPDAFDASSTDAFDASSTDARSADTEDDAERADELRPQDAQEDSTARHDASSDTSTDAERPDSLAPDGEASGGGSYCEDGTSPSEVVSLPCGAPSDTRMVVDGEVDLFSGFYFLEGTPYALVESDDVDNIDLRALGFDGEEFRNQLLIRGESALAILAWNGGGFGGGNYQIEVSTESPECVSYSIVSVACAPFPQPEETDSAVIERLLQTRCIADDDRGLCVEEESG